MQQFYVTVFVILTVSSWMQDGEASKCNLTVVDRVLKLYQKYWNVPSGIIEKSIELSPDFAVASTDDYFSNQEDISCVSTTWDRDAGFTATIKYKNGESAVYPGSPVVERPGQTYLLDSKVRRYRIPTGYFVNAFYNCEEEGEEGPPKGLVKVWKGYNSSDLGRAICELEYVLGTKLSQRFEPCYD